MACLSLFTCELIPMFASVLSIQYYLYSIIIYLLLSLSWTFCPEFFAVSPWNSRKRVPRLNITRESSTLTQQGAKRARETIVVRDSSSRHGEISFRSSRKHGGKALVVIRRRVGIVEIAAWNRYVGWVFRRGTPAANCLCKRRKSRQGIPRGVYVPHEFRV